MTQDLIFVLIMSEGNILSLGRTQNSCFLYCKVNRTDPGIKPTQCYHIWLIYNEDIIIFSTIIIVFSRFVLFVKTFNNKQNYCSISSSVLSYLRDCDYLIGYIAAPFHAFGVQSARMMR